MSIATYSDLKTAVTNWTKRDDLTSYLDDIILTAEQWIYRNVRAREMETALSITTTTGSVAPLPSDFLLAKTVIYTTGGENRNLTLKTPAWLRTKFLINDGACPEFFAIEGSNMLFGPGIASGITITGTYYKDLGSVASSAHALFVAHPDLYLWASLAEASLFLKNPTQGSLWTAKRDQIKNDVNGISNSARSADGMAVSAG